MQIHQNRSETVLDFDKQIKPFSFRDIFIT